MLWRRRVEPILRPLIFAWFKLSRGLTLGVRGIVRDGEGRVLLIEHTYTHGWFLPGGGVERGETAEQSLERELVEEAGVRLTGRARLVSVHSNEAYHRGDHVLVYLCEAWEPCPPTQKGEIHQIAWFHLDALPDTLKPGHRRRLAEVFGEHPPDAAW